MTRLSSLGGINESYLTRLLLLARKANVQFSSTYTMCTWDFRIEWLDSGMPNLKSGANEPAYFLSQKPWYCELVNGLDGNILLHSVRSKGIRDTWGIMGALILSLGSELGLGLRVGSMGWGRAY